MLRTIILAVVLLSLAFAAGADFDPRDHGAKADGVAYDTAALQSAIDACHDAGGGAVTLSPGTYLTGALELKSNVGFHIEKGATLLGSDKLEDYPPRVPNLGSYTDNYTKFAIIYAEDAENISVTGAGTIDGQGAAFDNATYDRPYVLRLVSCRNVAVRDIRMVDGAMWTVHFLNCDNVDVAGVTICSRVNKNNDGLDIDGCRNVRIANCDISSGDDAIVLKSTFPRPSENVAIANCVLSTACNAIKMGTESNGGFKNVTISNCAIYDTRISGLALEIVDGGTLDGVCVSNLSMKGVGCAIFVRLGNRARPHVNGGKRPGIGALRNVVISNVEAIVTNPIGCSITGMPGHPVENLTLDNVRIRFPGGNDGRNVEAPVPEAADSYPEYKMFGVLPAYGFYCRHARNISFTNVDLSFKKEDARPAIVCDDVEQLDITRLTAEAADTQPAVLWLKDTRDARIVQSRVNGNARAFVRLDGPETREIDLDDNRLPDVKKAIAK